MEAKRRELVVLDASAIVAFLRDEPARATVEELLRRQPSPAISAVNLAEVIDVLVRVGGQAEEAVNNAIDLLIVGGLEVQPFWLPEARYAAAVRSRLYGRSTAPLSLADCVCIATARTLGAKLATADGVFADAAMGSGVAVIRLPNSEGEAS